MHRIYKSISIDGRTCRYRDSNKVKSLILTNICTFRYISDKLCINKQIYPYISIYYMGTSETVDETKTTVVIPTELLDDFKHLAIDMKTTVTALIVESMRLYLKEFKKK